MSGISGSVKPWIAATKRLQSSGFRQTLNAQFALRTQALIQKSFATSTDPYGAAWATLKYRRGRPLILTGTLMGSIRVQVANGFVIVASAPYGAYHNYGTRTIPKRQFIPTSLPPTWVAEYQRIFAKNVRSAFAT